MMQNVLKTKRQRMLAEQQKRRKYQRRSPATPKTKNEHTEKKAEESYIDQVKI